MENNNTDLTRTSSSSGTSDVHYNHAQQELAIRPMLLEPRPFRPFKSSEEYLYAMKEDLADWLTTLYTLDIQADTFMEVLETGVVLCRHANNVRKMALEYQQSGRNGLTYPVPDREVTFRTDVVPCTFQARDNVSNFISWCRALGIYECLLFETDDLVLRKNEKSFILCLLEVARRGSKVGMLAPLLVQLEEEIDREIAKENARRDRATMVDCGTSPDDDYDLSSSSDEEQKMPPPQIITNDLKSLDEMVRDLVNRCTCPLQFPMIRVSEGKYRIGDTKVLIYVRILRSHVMVRVGGGWDTLEHYLDKHDPCRCRQGHRAALSSKLTVKFGVNSPAQTQMEVTYQRSPNPISPPSHASPFVPTSNRHRSVSPNPHPPPPITSPPRQRRASTSSTSSSSHKLSNGSLASLSGDKQTNVGSSEQPNEGTNVAPVKIPSASPCDSSSEYSDDGYKSGSRIPTLLKSKKYSPKKLVKLTENGATENEDQNDSPRDSLLGEEEDDEEDRRTDNRFDVAAIKDNATLHHPMNIPKCPSKKTNGVPVKHQQSPTDEHGSTRMAVNIRTRRLSGETFPSIGRRMPRSRSQSNEVGDMSLTFVRNQGGRHSYRTTRVPMFADGYGALPSSGRYGSATSSDRNHTWTCRPRSSRRSLSPDLFGGRSPPTVSPQRTTAPNMSPRSSPVKNRTVVPRSLQTSPSKQYAPLLQQMLADSKLDSDDKVLRRMASILQQRKTLATSRHNVDGEQHFVPHHHSMDDPCCGWTQPTTDTVVDSYSRKRHSSSGASQGIASPDSGSSDIGLEQSRLQVLQIPTPIKISPRKDNHPKTESKIPLPTYY